MKISNKKFVNRSQGLILISIHFCLAGIFSASIFRFQDYKILMVGLSLLVICLLAISLSINYFEIANDGELIYIREWYFFKVFGVRNKLEMPFTEIRHIVITSNGFFHMISLELKRKKGSRILRYYFFGIDKRIIKDMEMSIINNLEINILNGS